MPVDYGEPVVHFPVPRRPGCLARLWTTVTAWVARLLLWAALFSLGYCVGAKQ